jgi:hypothetical protein
MKKSTFISLFFLLLFVANYTKAQTIPVRNFAEYYSAVWSQYDGQRGIDNFNLYLKSNSDNLGVQVKASGDLSNNYKDSWYRNVNSYLRFTGLPYWCCKRDLSTKESFKTKGDVYCQSTGLLSFYKVGGNFKKVNDSTYDVVAQLMSQRNENSVLYALDVFIVEDSIYYRQVYGVNNGVDLDSNVYHRNVMVAYFRTLSGEIPKDINANNWYQVSKRIKVKSLFDEKKLSIIVVGVNLANNAYLNAGGSEAMASETPGICMVTVDSTNKNNIIWKPLVTKGKVYLERETNITNKFVVIDSAFSAKPRVVKDKQSNPAIKSEAYRLRYIDTSKYKGFVYSISNPSNTHRTIHLSINKGTGNDWNLIWSPYQGFNVVSYDIMRKLGSGAWAKIASVSGNVYSYTDLNVSSTNVAYKISVISPVACDPNAWSIYASESNIADQNYLKNLLSKNSSLSISPNPVSSILTINASHECGALKQFEILDISGRLVINGRIRNFTDIVDVSSLKNGVYSIHCLTEQGSFTKQFVK